MLLLLMCFTFYLHYIQVFSDLRIRTNRRGCLQAHPLLTPARPLCKTEEKNKNPLEILPSLRRMQFLHLVLAKCLTHNGTYILREAFPVISSGILIFYLLRFASRKRNKVVLLQCRKTGI